MIQRPQSHPAGTFVACSTCGTEPRHYLCYGRSQHEPIDVLGKAAGERHQLECRCGNRTAPKTSLVAAAAEWRGRFGQPREAAPVTRLRSANP